MMEYLQKLYAKFFGDGSGWEDGAANTPRKIVAFGNVLLDRTCQLSDTALLARYGLTLGAKGELDAETLSQLATEACQGVSKDANPGGSALNTVRILKQLGTEALFFGAVGVDQNAEELKDMLKQRGVETRLQTISDAPTGQCLCMVHADNTALYANIGASARFSVEYLRKAERGNNDDNEGKTANSFLRPIERKQILYIEGFFVPHRESVCHYIAKHYIRERRRLAFNLNAPYIVQENFEHVLQLAYDAFFIFGNHHEFQALQNGMGLTSLEQLADKLMQGGKVVKVIVVTCGADGVQLITNYVGEEEDQTGGGTITFQTYNVPRVTNVIDTTGAGDAFVAGFLHAWLEKRALSECVRMASDVAAKVVTQIGCNLPQ